MKKKALTAVAEAITVITALMILTGCPATEKQQDGFAIGFGQPLRTGAIVVAAQSDKSVFAIDEVTLNFYFGGYAVVNIDYLDDRFGGHQNEEDMLPIAVYFVDGDVYPSQISGTSGYPRFDDFRKVEGYHFVKEIPIDKFQEGDYLVKRDGKNKRSFSHSEMLTVPQDIFRIFNYAENIGYFYFFVGQVVYDFNAHKQTFLVNTDAVAIRYKFLNDTTLHLSRPGT